MDSINKWPADLKPVDGVPIDGLWLQDYLPDNLLHHVGNQARADCVSKCACAVSRLLTSLHAPTHLAELYTDVSAVQLDLAVSASHSATAVYCGTGELQARLQLHAMLNSS